MAVSVKVSVALLVFFYTLASCSSGIMPCSKVVLHAWCSASFAQDTAMLYKECERDFSFHESRCRVDEQGDYCGSFSDNLDIVKLASEACLNQTTTTTMTCSNECRQRLQVLKEDMGCCINEVLNTTTIGPANHLRLFEYSLWKTCGIDSPPENCPPSTLAKVPKPKTTGNCRFQEFFLRRFQIECKDSTLKALADDYNAHGCQQVSADLPKACSITEKGVWCVEKFLTNLTSTLSLMNLAQFHCSGNGNCTAECRTALQGIRSNLGCCINNLFNNNYFRLIDTEALFFSVLAKNEVWNRCGVTHRNSCKIKTFSGAWSAKFTWTTVLLLLAQFLY